MVFNKPTVEFVALDLDVITSSPGGGTPSLEQCQGPDAPGNNCKKYNFTIMNNPSSKAMESSHTKSSSSESHQFFNSFLPPMDS